MNEKKDDVDVDADANIDKLNKNLVFPSLDQKEEILRVIKTGLHEDLSNLGDITTLSTISEKEVGEAYYLAKENGVISGINIANEIFKYVDSISLKIEWFKKDGDVVKKGDIIGNLTGLSRSILIVERLSLNIMQRMSGIATQTYSMVQEIAKQKDSKSKLLDTRKTVPGLRVLDKMAVLHGGGVNHRYGLYDMILIKDNHVNAAGGIKNAIDNTHKYLKQHPLLNNKIKIEIETRTLDEVNEAIKYGKNKIHRIMLDNMVKINNNQIDVSMLEEALKLINQEYETEASGNINLISVGKVASTNVDYISCGSLTHSVKALDISLKFK